MKRILFTHSYFLRFDPKQWQIMQPYAPLGTIMAAAVVRNAGFEVKLWDPMFEENTSGLRTVIEDFNPDALVIYDDGFNYLTKMCLTNMREAAFEMTRMAGSKNIPVLVCSSDASDHYLKYLENGAFAVIKGEGENSLLEILKQFQSDNLELSAIDGLIFNKDGNVVLNQPREVMKDLDKLPLPAWDLVNIEKYKSAWIKNHGYFSINLSTTRGCPFKCNWCAKPIYGNRYNSRSPEHVISEITYLQDKYQPSHIWFCDDIFGLKPGWVNRFAEIVSERNIRLKYKIQSRVDLLLQENNIEALARSGCETVWVGAESGSQSILDAMDKGTRVEQIEQATHLLKKHHIKPAFFLQFGYPGETWDDIQKTIHMVKELLPDDIGISVSYPLPGTSFYEKVKSELRFKSNWSDSDDLAMMFANTFPPPFYKHLHRYVHKTYRIHQGLQILKQILKGKLSINLTALKRIGGIAYHQPAAWWQKRRMEKYRKLIDTSVQVPGKSQETKKAFDNYALNYDDSFTKTDTGILQRQTVYRFIARKISPAIYNQVLELNCGTGEDAIWLSKQGFNVLATDISKEMLNVATVKSATFLLENPPEFRAMSFNQLNEIKDRQFDLIFSNFGGLNCASPEQVRQLAQSASELLRPGGKFIAVVMGRNCFLEGVYFTFKNHEARGRRKSVHPVTATISSVSFPIWYYSPNEISDLCNPWLTEPLFQPVGFFIPPSWMNHQFSKSKMITQSADLLERMVGGLSSLSDFADHYIIELTKK